MKGFFNSIIIFSIFIAWPAWASQPAQTEPEPLISLLTVKSEDGNDALDRRSSILEKIHAAAKSSENLKVREKEGLKRSSATNSDQSSESQSSNNSFSQSPISKKSQIYQAIEYGSVAALFSTFIYLKIAETQTRPKRFFTGLEPLGASLIFKGIAGYAIPAILTIYSGYKINRWLHRACRSDLKKVEEIFEKKLEEHAKQVDHEIERIDHNVSLLANHTEELANTLLEHVPLGSAETTALQSITHQAETIQNQSRTSVKIQPKSHCCHLC